MEIEEFVAEVRTCQDAVKLFETYEKLRTKWEDLVKSGSCQEIKDVKDLLTKLYAKFCLCKKLEVETLYREIDTKRQKMCHPATILKDGTYEIIPNEAYATLIKQSVIQESDSFEELWRAMPAPTPNPYNPQGSPILRRQGCWSKGGLSYHFAGQVSEYIGEITEAPRLIRQCKDHAGIISDIFGVDASLQNVVHCNWYSGGKASLDYHQDNEAVSGRPIFSYTFLNGDPAYRYFNVCMDKMGRNIKCMYGLCDGDLLVMHGAEFQKKLWHGVPRTTRKEFQNQKRINITIRAWGDCDENDALQRSNVSLRGKKNATEKTERT